MSGFKYVIELIEEQMKLMRDEIRFAEGEEIKELKERYKDCNEAHLALTGLANGLNKQPEKALAINGVSVLLAKRETLKETLDYIDSFHGSGHDFGWINSKIREKVYWKLEKLNSQ